MRGAFCNLCRRSTRQLALFVCYSLFRELRRRAPRHLSTPKEVDSASPALTNYAELQ